MRTHYDWALRMQRNLLISRVKTRAIVSVLALLNNKFECIICVLYNDYHEPINKISFNRPNFPFLSLLSDTLVALDGTIPFDRAWFGYCPSGRIPCDNYGIPNVQLNWRHAQRCRTFPDSKSLKTDANSRAKTEIICLLLKSHEHR